MSAEKDWLDDGAADAEWLDNSAAGAGHSPEWLELSLEAHSDAEVERFEEALLAAGAVAISYSAADEEEIYEPPLGTMPLWARTGVTGLFNQGSDRPAILAALGELLGTTLPIAARSFADSQWTRAWLDHFQPIPFDGGPRRLIVAASEHVIDDPAAVVLRLDPGLAFGTGTHPSTAMCLQFLVSQDLRGRSVYDYGCGSGILGVAAALLGADPVYQTDIDPQALRASADNAAKNGVAERIHIVATPDAAPRVDILVANILLAPLCGLRAQFEKHTDADSVLVFAGLLERQEEELRAAYAGYQIERLQEREGWICLQLRRNH